MSQMPSHAHGNGVPFMNNTFNGIHATYGSEYPFSGFFYGDTAYSGGGGSHTHSMSGSVNGGGALPPYYALAYIMKL
jgi:hypothetical protein